MDKRGFQRELLSLNLNEEQIGASLAVAESFEAFVAKLPNPPSASSAWAFSRLLIEEGNNTEDNYRALIRYFKFIGNHEMFVAMLEVIDGGEVGDNLYRMVSERFGIRIRDDVFRGIGIAPYGTPSPDKPGYLHPVLHRLQAKVGEQACNEFLSVCMRDLPEKNYLPQREEFRKAGNIDEYNRRRKAAFITRLEACMREGKPFFAQEITPEVIDFVRNQPEIGGGRREGDIVYETKMPYMTKEYLAEKDPVLKRYHACHCPWARDAIRSKGVKLLETFCYCSAGFHKKPWEVIFDQPLRVEVLESALRGDTRCRFAIHLPREASTPKSGIRAPLGEKRGDRPHS